MRNRAGAYRPARVIDIRDGRARMDFEISDELRMMVDVVREFRERELMPLEHHFLVQGRFTAEERDAIDAKAKAAELWALDVPEDLGGQGVGELAMCLILEELYKHPAMYSFGGSPEPVLYHCAPSRGSATSPRGQRRAAQRATRSPSPTPARTSARSR